MYVQHCVKGIAGTNSSSSSAALTKGGAFGLVTSGMGIISNWWRKKGMIGSHEAALVLTAHNLDRHLHDYANFGPNSPFISLASGCVERDRIAQRNCIYSAIDTALGFATDFWSHPGALFFCWTPVAPNPAVEVVGVSEATRGGSRDGRTRKGAPPSDVFIGQAIASSLSKTAVNVLLRPEAEQSLPIIALPKNLDAQPLIKPRWVCFLVTGARRGQDGCRRSQS